jgi:hypothetical protein
LKREIFCKKGLMPPEVCNNPIPLFKELNLNDLLEGLDDVFQSAIYLRS